MENQYKTANVKGTKITEYSNILNFQDAIDRLNPNKILYNSDLHSFGAGYFIPYCDIAFVCSNGSIHGMHQYGRGIYISEVIREASTDILFSSEYTLGRVFVNQDNGEVYIHYYRGGDTKRLARRALGEWLKSVRNLGSDFQLSVRHISDEERWPFLVDAKKDKSHYRVFLDKGSLNHLSGQRNLPEIITRKKLSIRLEERLKDWTGYIH